MDTVLGLLIMAQIALTMFIVWGYMHEDLFTKFENKLFSRLISKTAGKKLRLIIGGKEKSGKNAA